MSHENLLCSLCTQAVTARLFVLILPLLGFYLLPCLPQCCFYFDGLYTNLMLNLQQVMACECNDVSLNSWLKKYTEKTTNIFMLYQFFFLNKQI